MTEREQALILAALYWFKVSLKDAEVELEIDYIIDAVAREKIGEDNGSKRV